MENPSPAPPSVILAGGHLYVHGVLIGGALVVPYAGPVMENPLRAPPSTPVIDDTQGASYAHPAMESPLTTPHSATIMHNQLKLRAESQTSHETRPTIEAPASHCKREDANIKQKCWELLMTFQLRQETVMKWDILLRDPISKRRKELAEGLHEGMMIVKACMNELNHAVPDRQHYLNSHIWHLRILLSTLLDVGIGFESITAPVCILEFLRGNPCQFSDQFRNVIRQTYLDGESLELGVART